MSFLPTPFCASGMNINSVQVQTAGCLPETHAQSSLCFQKDKEGEASWPLPCSPSLSEVEPLLSTAQVSESHHKLHQGFFSRIKLLRVLFYSLASPTLCGNKLRELTRKMQLPPGEERWKVTPRPHSSALTPFPR